MVSRISHFLFSMVLIMGATSAMAQKQFTLEDLNFGGNNYHNMVPKHQYTTWWGNELVRTDVEDCYTVDKNTGKETELFSLGNINKWSGMNLHHLYNITFPVAG